MIEVEGRRISIGGPRPSLREKDVLKRWTYSICPECYRLLPAALLERDGKVWILRACPDHGEVEEIYWADALLYDKAMRFEAPISRVKTVYRDVEGPCPFSCGLCPIHITHTCLANVVVTNRCDLACWYCFFYSEKAGFVYEPTLEQYREMMRELRRQYPHGARAIQLTGGEPMVRDDIIELVRITKEEGIEHIQLNTNAIRFSFEDGAKLAKGLREAGLNTIYMSFDGISPDVNFKNHWEAPYALKNFQTGGMTSVVLVPTAIKGWNDHELGPILKFAAANMDVIRGVNFQPVSLTGLMPKEERERYRITIPEVIRLIEDQTDGQITKDDWYPTSITYALSSLIEGLTKRSQWHMRIHPCCGMATYVYVDRSVPAPDAKFIPITDMIDVEGLFEYLKEKAFDLKRAKSRHLIALKVLLKLRKFIIKEKLPKGFNLYKIIFNIFLRHNYQALGEFNYRFMYIGMMHFMDLYNYDVQRVMRCGVHYITSNLKVIPFCTFNVLSDIYRDCIQKEYGMSLKDYERIGGKLGEQLKYKRDVKKLKSSDIYRRTYEPFLRMMKA